MKQLRTVLGVMLVMSFVSTGFSAEDLSLKPGPSPLQAEGAVPYNLPALLDALADLTDWRVKEWPIPQVLQVPSEAFQGWTQLNARSFFGQYDAETNRVFLNLRCRSKWPEHPEAYCQAVLFHELVHWGQYHTGIDKKMGGTEQEGHAMEYEKRYVETTLSLQDMYPPPRPTPAELPPRETPIRLMGPPRRASARDVDGHRQRFWIMTGPWIEAPSMKRYHAEVIYHHGHWIGLMIFRTEPLTGRQLVEAWWDKGYLPPQRDASFETSFPADPVYRGRWVRVR
ncbi:MAG: hypothetical protein ACE5FK_02585 [Candidatus Methylomirabilia bacterium]